MNNQILPYDFIKLKDEITINGIYTFFYQEKDVSFIFPGETHDFWELIYMDKGFAYLLIDDKGFKINQGELFFSIKIKIILFGPIAMLLLFFLQYPSTCTSRMRSFLNLKGLE